MNDAEYAAAIKGACNQGATISAVKCFVESIRRSERERCAKEIERRSGETYAVLLCEHKEAADWLRSNVALRGAEPASSAERPLEGTVMRKEEEC